MVSEFKKTNRFPIRAVHLDLKGLVPTYARLLELLELFASANYNALFIEWEDMFPWSVYEQFRSHAAYTEMQVSGICEKAASLGIQVIPIVQSFGHMETFLKVEKYAHLREQQDRTDCLNPLAEGASDFVIKLIEDVIKLVPNISYFHIGADEVWTLGSNPDTSSFIKKYGKGKLFLHHIKPILKYLCDRNVRPILWHDMLSEWDSNSLRELADLADVMIWDYTSDFESPDSLAQLKYVKDFADAGIKLWAATAFKGADGNSSDLPILKNRHKNAFAWYENAENIEFKGIVATGWNRYSTGQPQCEPIEAALDSVVSIGEILCNGTLGDYTKKLTDTDNMERFNNCKSLLRDFSDSRRYCWITIQLLHELFALSEIDSSRRGSGRMQDNYGRLEVKLNQLKDLSNKVIKEFSGLVEQECLDMYVSERILAIENAKKNLDMRF